MTATRIDDLDVLRFFDANASFVKEDGYREQRRVRTRLFAGEGDLRSEQHFDESGRLHGRQLTRYAHGAATPYAEPGLAEELAEFFYNHPVGKARLLWHSGRTLGIDRGTAPSSGDDYEAVFSDQEHTSEAWLEQSRQYEAAQQVRHGACAVARAAASAKSGQPLRDWLTTHVVALQPARARELAEELERDAEGNVARLLSALLLGAEPWVVFRMVATALANRPRAAHDFVDAALLLTPGDSDCLWTRAMTRLELGRIADALGDAEHVTQASPTLGAFIRDYARLLFPSWRFLAADELVSASFDGLSEAPLQPLSEVRRVVQVYATRLLLLRQAVLARSGVPTTQRGCHQPSPRCSRTDPCRCSATPPPSSMHPTTRTRPATRTSAAKCSSTRSSSSARRHRCSSSRRARAVSGPRCVGCVGRGPH
ncbi:MAG: hypothetical protein QM756_15850 [Polyangiaceae bacterium]